MQGELFAITNGQYQILQTLDTLLETGDKIDATKSIIELGTHTLTSFIAQNLTRSPAGSPAYSFKEVEKLDSIRKRGIPLYNLTGAFTEGVYLSYSAFASQQPNQKVATADVEEYMLLRVRATDGNGSEKVKPQKAYAVVYQGIPYVATDLGFYRLRKSGEEFLFSGQLENTPSGSGKDAFRSTSFGLIGAILTSSATSIGYYELKIDYRNGQPVMAQAPAGRMPYIRTNIAEDALLKADLPLFNKEPLSEGLYLTWNSFAQQRPDYQVKAQAGNGILMNVKTVGEKENRRFNYKEMYAIVYDVVPYIATNSGYYKLKKVAGDWLFTSRVSVIDSTAGNAATTFEIALDPTDGHFIKLRDVTFGRSSLS